MTRKLKPVENSYVKRATWKTGTCKGQQDLGPCESARCRSPQGDARQDAPHKQRDGENGGDHRQALMPLSEVGTHHHQAEYAKETADDQEDGDDFWSVFHT